MNSAPRGRRRRLYVSVVMALLGTLMGIGVLPLLPNINRLQAASNVRKPLRLTSPNRPASFTSPLAIPPVLTGTNITLQATEADIPLLSGTPTRMWTYNGIFPGPTIHQTSGQTTRLTFVNNLPAAGDLTLHHHGSHSTGESDGQPDSYLVAPGASYTYIYTGTEDGANERGAMHWYHDHMMDMTGHHVWMGLAGMYIIDDPADPQTLPSGQYDVPLMIMDRAFDSNNQLVYIFDQNGVEGDQMLVNGVIQPYFEVADRKYRLRILNASNFSDIDLQLSNGQPMIQIGTESGLLPAPVSRQHILLGPAERADIVVDFAGQFGQQIVLLNLAGQDSTSQIMQFRVTGQAIDDSFVPPTLRPLPDLGTPVMTRTFAFGHTDEHWTINGLRYDPNRMDAQPVLGTTEKWILQNNTGEWNHVIHIHLTNHLIVARNGVPPEPYEAMKESWYLNPGDTIELLIKFSDYTGLYVFHCHLLEHEDDGMMGQFQVVATAPTLTPTPTITNTPINTRTPTRTRTGTPTFAPTCPPGTPTVVGVSIVNFAFNPQTVSISQGSTVRWTNNANRNHTSTSNSNIWSSTIGPGQSLSVTFNSVGTFGYHCNIHPVMTGNVNVLAPVCAPATPAPTSTRTNTRVNTSTSTATSTPTYTSTPTPGSIALLVGHVTWQGRTVGSTAHQLPISLTLKLGSTEINYPQQNTDLFGFFTVTVDALANGTYDYRVKDARYLASVGKLALTGVATTQVEIGQQRAGDAFNDNVVNLGDFSVLKTTFGKLCNDSGYDDRADFNGDCSVTLSDFSLLKGNFGQVGPAPLQPGGP